MRLGVATASIIAISGASLVFIAVFSGSLGLGAGEHFLAYSTFGVGRFEVALVGAGGILAGALMIPELRRYGLAAAALSVLVPIFYHAMLGFPYQSGDGHFYVTTLRYLGDWATPFQTEVPTFAHGMVGAVIPLNIWLNPGQAAIALLPPSIGNHLANVLFISFYFLGSFGALRLMGGPPFAALATASAAVVITFPPFNKFTPFFQQFAINPGVSFNATLGLIGFGMFVRSMAAETVRARILWTLGVAGVLVYSILNDPGWALLTAMSVTPVFLAAALCKRRGMIQLVLTGVVALAVLVSTGLIDYVQAYIEYSARYMLRDWVPGFDATTKAAAAFAGVRGAIWMTAVIWACVYWIRRRRTVNGGEVPVAVAVLAHIAAMTGFTLIYWSGLINWVYPPLPYFEIIVIPLYLFPLVHAVSMFLTRPGNGFQTIPRTLAERPMRLLVPVIVVVAAIPLAVRAAAPVPDRYTAPLRNEFVSYLSAETGIAPSNGA
ncbi:MAG: hypothetical protein JJ855_05900 [Rhodospirillales bacterium]|nr:hypothetical protein [Rhodospirillales bacterium]